MAIWEKDGIWYDDMNGEALNLPSWPQEGLRKLTDAEVEEAIAAANVPTSESVRAERDARISAVQWRIERWNRETRLGLKPTEDITVLDKYIQTLCAVPEQASFPAKVKWPKEV